MLLVSIKLSIQFTFKPFPVKLQKKVFRLESWEIDETFIALLQSY